MNNTPRTTFGSGIAVLNLHGLVGIDVDKSDEEASGSYNLGRDEAIIFAARLVEACGSDVPSTLRLVAVELGFDIPGAIIKPPQPLPKQAGSIIEFTYGDSGDLVRASLHGNGEWYSLDAGGRVRPEHPVTVRFDAAVLDNPI